MDIRKVREELRYGGSIYALPLRVTFYARVSTEKYEQASSLENQVDYYTEYIQKNEHWTYVEGYVDDGISGTSTVKRDDFNRMIADAKNGLFDLIITKEISRFSRNTLDSIQYTQDLLRTGVGVFFQNDNINTLDTDSEFRLVVMAGVAQDEVRKLSERLKFGFNQSIKNGRVLGNNRMYGYHKDRCKMTINEEEAEIIRVIFDLYVNQKLGFRRIAQQLTDQYGYTSHLGNEFNIATVKNIIKNPKYKGFYCGNKTKNLDYRTKERAFLDESEWVMYQDESIPAIVSEALWEEANAILKQRSASLRQSGAQFHNYYPYSGKIICGEHGTTFHRSVLKSKKGEKEVWNCKTYRQRGKAACSAPQVRSSELDEILAEVFTQMIHGKEKYVQTILSIIASMQDKTDYQGQMDKITSEKEDIEAKKDKLLEMSIDGLIGGKEFKSRNERFNVQLEKLDAKLKHLEGESKKKSGEAKYLQEIQKMLEKELNFEDGINTKLVACLLDRVVVHNTGDRNRISLEIHLKMGKMLPYSFDRKKACVCDSPLKNTIPRPETRTI